jgi:hypothetical protein
MRIALLRVVMKLLPMAVANKALPSAKAYTTLVSKSAARSTGPQQAKLTALREWIALTLPGERSRCPQFKDTISDRLSRNA